MYNKTVFLDMGLYEICIVAAIVVALMLADKMGIKRGFSVRLQKLVIFGAMGGVVIGFFGAVLFQAFYNYMDTGVFTSGVLACFCIDTCTSHFVTKRKMLEPKNKLKENKNVLPTGY